MHSTFLEFLLVNKIVSIIYMHFTIIKNFVLVYQVKSAQKKFD